MSRTPVLVVLVCAAIALVVAGCGDDSAKLEKSTLKIGERDTDEFAFVDNAPRNRGPIGERGPKLSRGDQIGFRSDLIRGKKDVGDLVAHCFVVTAGGGRFDKADVECTGVYELPEGKLFAAAGGPDGLAGAVKGAVTGGTDKYEGATGSFSSPEAERGVTQSTFTIQVPKD